MTNLTKLANKHNTDKGTVAYEAHGYTDEYSKYIPETGKYTLLEIGIYHGDSLRMWKEYNPELQVYGVDIDFNIFNYIKSEENNGKVFHTFLLDATKEKECKEMINIISERENSEYIDFIIDDGSHRYEDIWASFCLLYPKLKSGGYYFIEDLHASYAQRGRIVTDINLHPDVNIENVKLVCNDKLLIIQKP